MYSAFTGKVELTRLQVLQGSPDTNQVSLHKIVLRVLQQSLPGMREVEVAFNFISEQKNATTVGLLYQ